MVFSKEYFLIIIFEIQFFLKIFANFVTKFLQFFEIFANSFQNFC